MRATIKMIAERAGVSIGTVDRVLHDRPYVKAEVRARVLQVMEELDYRPNRMASALATSATPRRLAVVQPLWEGYVAEDILSGVVRFREEHQDYNLTVTTEYYPRAHPEECVYLLDRLAAEDVQGVALCAIDCPEVREKMERMAQRGIPVVTFNSDVPGAPRMCYVGEDAHHAGRIAGEMAAKFYRTGQQMMVVYGGPEYVGHKGRADGFIERLVERGVRPEDILAAATHNSYDQTFSAVSAALEESPSLGYIYMANQSVDACVEALRRAGKTGQVRIISHDASPSVCHFLKEGLVDFTIGQNLTYQSYKALAILFDAAVAHKQPEREFFYPESPILNAEMV